METQPCISACKEKYRLGINHGWCKVCTRERERTGSSNDLTAILFGVSTHIPKRFCVGDTVEVLRAARLPQVEEVIGSGKVEAVLEPSEGSVEALYLVSGFPILRSARVLRLVVRER